MWDGELGKKRKAFRQPFTLQSACHNCPIGKKLSTIMKQQILSPQKGMARLQ